MPEPIRSNVLGMFDYQFHQVAMYFPGGPWQAKSYMNALGYSNWHSDRATLHGFLDTEEVNTEAVMCFNYDIMPMELELLYYSGPSRWAGVDALAHPFVSHMSVYTDDVVADTKRMTQRFGAAPFHRFITKNHTNPRVAGKKRFIESIFNTHAIMGFDIKLIQKVPHDFNDDEWLGLEF